MLLAPGPCQPGDRRWLRTERKHSDQCSALINYPLTLTFISLSVAVTQQGQFPATRTSSLVLLGLFFFTCVFWHKSQKNTSPRAMIISSSVACPAMARHCQTLWHSEGCSGHAPLQLLCLSRGLPWMPGTVLPGVGPQGYGCCAELSHPHHPSGGHVCTHIAWSWCASVSSCVRGCSCSHTSPAHAHQLFVFLCWLHSVLLACWPWAQLLPVFLPAGSHPAFSSTDGLSQPKARFNRLPLVGLGWTRCPAAWDVCMAAATVTAVGWSIPLLQTPLARLGS